jgi:hypothetical protein
MAASALERGVTVLLERIGTCLWGFSPRMITPVVARLGPIRALAWFISNLPRYQRTLTAIGPIRLHLLCTAISLVNGCLYCTHGQAYALELAYLREKGRLFPLDAHAIGLLCGMPPGLIRHRMVTALEQAGLPAEIRWLERAIALAIAEDPSPTDDDDVRISHLVRMLAMLTSIGVDDSGTEADQALSPLNKDKALKERYAQMRAG